ncbi:MAG: glycine zipper family protein, partial [Nitrospiraceae bacterium]
MRNTILLILTISLAGCAGPKPVLYPNAHYKQVGSDVAEQDIVACREMAEKAGAEPGDGKASDVAKNTAISGGIGAAAGAVGGAIVGAAGSGSAVGAASGIVWGLLGSWFRTPDPG